MRSIVIACIIYHTMIIEDERDVQGLNHDYLNEEMQEAFIVTV